MKRLHDTDALGVAQSAARHGLAVDRAPCGKQRIERRDGRIGMDGGVHAAIKRGAQRIHPLGTIIAVYLSEFAGHKTRETLKPLLELLSAVPTIVYGYFALLFVTPILQKLIPSLPGYGFSARPTTPGWNPPRIAQASAAAVSTAHSTSAPRRTPAPRLSRVATVATPPPAGAWAGR